MAGSEREVSQVSGGSSAIPVDYEQRFSHHRLLNIYNKGLRQRQKKVISRSQIKKTQRKLSQSLASCGIKSVDFLRGQKSTLTQHLSAHLRQINN